MAHMWDGILHNLMMFDGFFVSFSLSRQQVWTERLINISEISIESQV